MSKTLFWRIKFERPGYDAPLTSRASIGGLEVAVRCCWATGGTVIRIQLVTSGLGHWTGKVLKELR
jgi:hypothetical protein